MSKHLRGTGYQRHHWQKGNREQLCVTGGRPLRSLANPVILKHFLPGDLEVTWKGVSLVLFSVCGVGKSRHRAVRWDAFHSSEVGSPDIKVLHKVQIPVYFPVKISLLLCASELARTCECAFQKTDLKKFLYCSRIKVNENNITLVKSISYLIHLLSLPCTNPRENIFSSRFWGYNALWCKALSSGELLYGIHLQEI